MKRASYRKGGRALPFSCCHFAAHDAIELLPGVGRRPKSQNREEVFSRIGGRFGRGATDYGTVADNNGYMLRVHLLLTQTGSAQNLSAFGTPPRVQILCNSPSRTRI
jgi:hypothetical protein